jgi:aspartyl protease family protein
MQRVVKQYATAAFFSLLFAWAPVGAVRAASSIEVLGLANVRAWVSVAGVTHMLNVGGDARAGARLIGATPDSAVVEYQGRQLTLRLSRRIGANYNVTQRAPVKIVRDAHGQFVVEGKINGMNRPLLVDTGASVVAISATEAAALGIEFEDAPRRVGYTAGGTAPYYEITLDEIDVHGIRVANVPAAVIDGDHPRQILLGMSFLRHVGLQQQGAELSMVAQ